MVSSLDPLPPSCRSSGTHMTFDVVLEPTAPCLPLLRDMQDLWCPLGPPVCLCSFAGPVVLCWYLLPAAAQRPEDPWCCIGNH